MENYYKIEINLKSKTMEKLDKLLNYTRIRSECTDRDLPKSYEDILKASLAHYLNHLDYIKNTKTGNFDVGLIELSKEGKLKNRIKSYIQEKGMKQKDLAEITNIDAGNISIILSNRSQPSLDYFLRIWISLGCPPISELFYKE